MKMMALLLPLLFHRLIVFPMLVYSQQLAIKVFERMGFLSLKKERMNGRKDQVFHTTPTLALRAIVKKKKKIKNRRVSNERLAC